MDNVILRELIKIENSASEYIKKAEEERKKLAERISKRTAEIDAKYESEIKAKLALAVEKTQAETLESVAELTRAGNEKIKSIETDFASGRSETIQRIFSNILFGSPDPSKNKGQAN